MATRWRRDNVPVTNRRRRRRQENICTSATQRTDCAYVFCVDFYITDGEYEDRNVWVERGAGKGKRECG